MAYCPINGTDINKATRKMAAEIQSSHAPELVEKELIEAIKTIKALKTQVLTDGDKVIVKHPVSGGKFEVLNAGPWSNDPHRKIVNYCVEAIDEGFDFLNSDARNISISYPKPATGLGTPANKAAYISVPIVRKHIIAAEIAKDFDSQLAKKAVEDAASAAKTKSTDETAKRLLGLFG